MTAHVGTRRDALGLLLLAAGLLVVNASDAWAYVDPGTGSYLFQLAAAGLLAAVYTMRSYVQALIGMIRGKRDTAPSSSTRANDMD
jgi:hypothetical protein